MAELETTFAELGLPTPILTAIESMGYEKPSPIQAACIPHLLEGRDVLGMAQTGSGKTAAFALPMLTRIQPEVARPQVLVLAPTRELAVQVSEAFGAFVSVVGTKEGLVHISQITDKRVEKVSDYLQLGQEVRVKVLEVDRQGRIRLSIKEAMASEGAEQQPAAE